MEEYFGSLNTPGLDEWAKANPALAYKEYKKSGQPDIATTEDIKGLMDDSGYTEDQAKNILEKVLKQLLMVTVSLKLTITQCLWQINSKITI